MLAVTPKNRLYRTFTYLPTDRVPDVEFGYWPQTIRRWAKEGFPTDLAEELDESMFSEKWDRFIGCDVDDEGGAGFNVLLGMNPAFEEKVLREDDRTVVYLDGSGVIAQRWKSGSDDSSIPHFIEFPVKRRADWEAMKERYRLDDPARTVPEDTIAEMRKATAEDWNTWSGACGFYGALRNWVGTENLSMLFYDDPELVHEMCEHWTALILHSLRQVPADVPIHHFGWWEDMAYNHGPLVSPATFAEFMVPCYQAVMDELRKHQCAISHVDCDGNIHDLVPGWLQTGVNVMFPCEVAAGTDMFRLRRDFGKEVRLKGGIDKVALAQGRDAIDRELERIAPLLDEGGFVPHLDHLVPPDISFEDYMYYREQKKKLIGKK
ncbi:MAG: uroporphyrinogen decarboxylase family protein [Armatimonadota bacterium]